MTAPALCCAVCGRRIAARGGHNVTDDGRVVCGRCIREVDHSAMFPACPVAWHDNYDHLRHVAGTRAATAAVTTLRHHIWCNDPSVQVRQMPHVTLTPPRPPRRRP